uniref:Uncharacterized protein n=1 Tax=Anopheles merus TaxID=30066 RepID=A0A182VKA1_ANOME
MYPNGEFGWSSGKPLSGTGSTNGASIIDRASPLAELRSDSSNMSTEVPQMEDSSRVRTVNIATAPILEPLKHLKDPIRFSTPSLRDSIAGNTQKDTRFLTRSL